MSQKKRVAPQTINAVAPEQQQQQQQQQHVFSGDQKRALYVLSVGDERRHTLGVCMVLLNVAVVVRWPAHYWILYLAQGLVLLPLRYVRFRRSNEELLLLDFCYFVTLFALVWTLVALVRLSSSGGGRETSFTRFDKAMARAGFAFTNGALVWSILIFKNAAIFHSVDHLTSAYVHLSPALFYYCLRWGSGWGPGAVHAVWPGLFRICSLHTHSDDGDGNGNGETRADAAYAAADACTLHAWCSDGCPADASSLIGVPILIYLVCWSVPYFLILFVLFPRCVEERQKETLFTFVMRDKLMSRFLLCYPEKPAFARPLGYQVQHLATVAVLGASSLLLWHCFWLHTAVLLGLGVLAVSNGSAYMFRYFSLRYAEKKLSLFTKVEGEAAPLSCDGGLELQGTGGAGAGAEMRRDQRPSQDEEPPTDENGSGNAPGTVIP